MNQRSLSLTQYKQKLEALFLWGLAKGKKTAQQKIPFTWKLVDALAKCNAGRE
jgi:hypothetical protein